MSAPLFDAIQMSDADNVASVLRAVAPGEAVKVKCGDTVRTVTATDAIPMGHKLALAAIGTDTPILKYSTPIGRATADIAPGAHVHVHNLTSQRAMKPRA